jgi:hypothetical protein
MLFHNSRLQVLGAEDTEKYMERPVLKFPDTRIAISTQSLSFRKKQQEWNVGYIRNAYIIFAGKAEGKLYGCQNVDDSLTQKCWM